MCPRRIFLPILNNTSNFILYDKTTYFHWAASFGFMKHVFFTCLILILFVFAPVKAFGCSCAPLPQLEEFKNSESVFIGRFIEDTKKGSKFRVVKSWKGVKANKTIYLNIAILDCGLEIKMVKGKEFLFYVPSRKEKPPFVDHNPNVATFWFVCGRSNAAEKAQEDIENMDKIATESKNQ